MPSSVRSAGGAALGLAVLCCAFGAQPARGATGCPGASRSLKPAARAAQVVAAMTTSEKLSMLTGVDPHAALGVGDGPLYVGYVPGVPRLCIPPITLNDGPSGVADTQVDTTSFPAPIAQASTWDPALQRTLGAALGLEASQKGVDVLLAPDVNIARVPENGRNFEAFGEDPFLAGRIAAAEIDGIQRNPVVATVKHYAVNSQETNRYSVSENLDDRTLHEIYLPPFEAAVDDAHVGAVMCAYGLMNATYSCQDQALLTTVLRQQLRFDGFVMSDWGATRSTVPAAASGLDLEMPGGVFFGSALADALNAGTVPMQTIDTMVRSILTSMFRLGVVDHPPPPLSTVALVDVSSPAHQALARRVAESGTVLLKNASNTLPLKPAAGSTIALVGAPAGFGDLRPYTEGGHGSAFVYFSSPPVSPVEAITTRAAKAGATVVSADGSDVAAAAAVARQASVAVVFAYDEEVEGTDRQDLSLPNGQDALIEQVAQANPNTIVVLETGGPVLMPWLGQVAGVVEAWYPGQEDGNAIAAVLFGDVDPGGRLPQTFPASDTAVPTSSAAQWPGTGDAEDAGFTEGLDVGYRWFDATKTEPLFPFGYGLSYTTFAYRKLHVARHGDGATLTFTVANTGRRSGTEVAQVYVDQPRAAGEPPKQLEGFRKVFVRPGRSVRVTIALTARAFSHWDPVGQKWRIRRGLYRILVGASSRDVRLRGFLRLH